MTDVDDRRTSPIRHGQTWTEQDFADLMQAVRQDCTLEEVAEAVGRSVNGLRNQLRRMLPADERHLPADVVLMRIRQLNRNGDYDWLAAMAEQPTPEWQLRWEADQRSRAALLENARVVGVGALPDDHLMALAKATLDCRDPLPSDLAEVMAKELSERGLTAALADHARERLDGILARILRQEPQIRWQDESGDLPPFGYDEPPYVAAGGRHPWA